MIDHRTLDRAQKIRDNQENITTIHREKAQNSSPFYKDAKITTCSSVLMKNGQAVAVAFKMSPRAKDNSLNRSLERDSVSQ